MSSSGEIPEQLDIRIERRDPPTFSRPEEFLGYQRVSLGKNPSRNVRWTLADDGALRIAPHSATTDDWQQPFDVPIPDAPNGRVSKWTVRKIRRLLAREGFAAQDPYQVGARVKGGDAQVVTARTSHDVHQVIYVAVFDETETKLLRCLRELTDAHLGEQD